MNQAKTLWSKLDENILAAYKASEEGDDERAFASYETAIQIAVTAEAALPDGQTSKKINRNFLKSDLARLAVNASFYPSLRDRDLSDDKKIKETELAMALRGMGIKQQKSGDPFAASMTFARCAEIFENTNPISNQAAWCYFCAGLLGSQSAERREYLYRRSLALYEELAKAGEDESNSIVDTLDALGHSLIDQGKHEEAFAIISRCIDAMAVQSDQTRPIPPFLELSLAGLVNGGVLHEKLANCCQKTGRPRPPAKGLPSRGKQILSLVITIAFFWFLLGSPWTAAGFLTLLFVHEMGHFIASKQVGVKVTPPIFTPMGAVITMLSQPASAKEEAYFAIAGPALGTVGALIAFGIGTAFSIADLTKAAQFAFGLNFFNLIPLAPMDGGRISMAISRRLWILGLLLYVSVALLVVGYSFVDVPGGSPMSQKLATLPLKLFVLYWVGRGAYIDLKMRQKMAKASPQYFRIPLRVRIGYAAAYFGLGALLIFMIVYSTEHKV